VSSQHLLPFVSSLGSPVREASTHHIPAPLNLLPGRGPARPIVLQGLLANACINHGQASGTDRFTMDYRGRGKSVEATVPSPTTAKEGKDGPPDLVLPPHADGLSLPRHRCACRSGLGCWRRGDNVTRCRQAHMTYTISGRLALNKAVSLNKAKDKPLRRSKQRRTLELAQPDRLVLGTSCKPQQGCGVMPGQRRRSRSSPLFRRVNTAESGKRKAESREVMDAT